MYLSLDVHNVQFLAFCITNYNDYNSYGIKKKNNSV